MAAGTLDGKVIIVSGAGSGIGKATAEAVGAAGATVITTDIKGQDDTAAAITEAGGEAEAHQHDVTSADAWDDVVKSTLDRHGKVDGLANVAGVVSAVDNLLNLTEEEWDRITDVDLKGVWLGMRAVAQPMIDAGGGRIVNVASVAGLIGMGDVLAYSASKGGVLGMGRQVAVQYASQGLRVNTICPGVIETPMLGDITDELLTAVKAATPTGFLGTGNDIAAMMVFLFGGPDFITGQQFVVDGGWTAQ